MIYFDSAATTFQKPQSVFKAMESAMLRCGNPGRSGHRPSLLAAKTVYECREAVCDLFHFPQPENVVFTMNATHALNLAIKSTLKNGGHAVIGGYEHNSVVRPLEALKDSAGVSYTVAYSPLFDQEAQYDAIKQAIIPETKCVIINHMSNVFGFIAPLSKINQLCLERGIDLIIDASQSAGILEINASELSASFICMPGHKSLYGPQGTGILLCCKAENAHSLLEGGTGSNSREVRQPDFLPDMLESGTLNVPGIAGLLEGISFVRTQGIRQIAEKKYEHLRRLSSGLGQIRGITAYFSAVCQNGLISFTAPVPSEELCGKLGELGFCLRGGLHCAPLAHQSANTLPDGTCRVSLSVFNDRNQVEQLISIVNKLMTKGV